MLWCLHGRMWAMGGAVAIRCGRYLPRGVLVGVTVVFGLASCTADERSATGPTDTNGAIAERDCSRLPSHAQRLVVPISHADNMPTSWRETFVVPYGRGRAQLGTSRGGETDDVREYGPESGAQGPDGTWWFLDVAKRRLAHYGANGRFIEEVGVPPSLLVNDHDFEWALPHVLSDGTLVAFRLADGSAAMLRLRDGTLSEIPLTAMFTPTYDDGQRVYGTVAGTNGASTATLNPDTGAVNATSEYRMPSGQAFTLSDNFDMGTVKVAIGTQSVILRTVTPSGALVHVGVQVRATADDSLHLFLFGSSDVQSSTQRVGYVRIKCTGATSKLESLPDPFSAADRGSPAQLVVAPGASSPMLVYVQSDGVHIYRHVH